MNSLGFQLIKNAVSYVTQNEVIPNILGKFIKQNVRETLSQSALSFFKSLSFPSKQPTLLYRARAQLPQKTNPTNALIQKQPNFLGAQRNKPQTLMKKSFHSETRKPSTSNFLQHSSSCSNTNIKSRIFGSTILGSLGTYLFYSSAYAKEQPKILDMDDLEKIARIIKVKLPEKEEAELHKEWQRRCEQFCFEMVLKLCENNEWGKFDLIEDYLLNNLTDKWGRSLLLAAAQQGSTEFIKKLLSREISLARTDAHGNTPLHLATEMGRTGAVEILYKYYFATRNSQEETALHVSIRRGHSHLINLLLDNGIPQTARCKYQDQEMDGFTLAVALGRQECFDELVLHMNSPDFKKRQQKIGNLLHVAIHYGQKGMLWHLLTKHYKETKDLVNQADDDEGRTPLHLACYKGLVEEVEFLIAEKNAQYQKRNNKSTPVHWAVIGACSARKGELQNYIDTIEMLGYLKVPAEEKDEFGLRPEDYATKSTHLNKELILNCLQKVIASKGKMDRPNFPEFLPEQLSLPGGGPKGIALVGALKALKEKGFLSNVHKVVGTSAGAITATLLAVGYSPDELEKILLEFDFIKLLDPTKENQKLLDGLLKSAKSKTMTPLITTLLKENVQNLLHFSPLDLFDKLSKLEGLCEGEVFRKWIDDLIAKKVSEITGKSKKECEHLTFGELKGLIDQGKPCKHLFLVATQIEKDQRSICFNSLSNSLDPDWEKIIVSDIARASMSIPGAFKPHTTFYKNPITKERYAHTNSPKLVDGGLMNNSPGGTFDFTEFQTDILGKKEWNSQKSNPRTLIISLREEKDPTKQNDPEIKGSLDLIMALCSIFYNSEAILSKGKDYNRDRLIEIPILKGVGLLDFDVSKEEKKEMIERGKKAVEESPILQKKKE